MNVKLIKTLKLPVRRYYTDEIIHEGCAGFQTQLMLDMKDHLQYIWTFFVVLISKIKTQIQMDNGDVVMIVETMIYTK